MSSYRYNYNFKIIKKQMARRYFKQIGRFKNPNANVFLQFTIILIISKTPKVYTDYKTIYHIKIINFIQPVNYTNSNNWNIIILYL